VGLGDEGVAWNTRSSGSTPWAGARAAGSAPAGRCSTLSLFAERGIAGTRLEDLTGRADLGKGAVYNYYEQAVGLAPGVSTLERMLAGGLPPLFEARRHAGAAAPIDGSRSGR